MFLQSKDSGKSLTLRYSWGLGEVTCSGISLGDSLWQVYLSDFSLGFSSDLGLVSLRTSLVQVSVGTAQEQSCSMPKLLMPLISRNVPPSPQ